MPVYTETKMGSNEVSLDRQYVHCSGHMFMLITSPNQALKIRQRLASGGTMKKPSFLNRLSYFFGKSVFLKNFNCFFYILIFRIIAQKSTTNTETNTYVTRNVNVKNKEELIDLPRKVRN